MASPVVAGRNESKVTTAGTSHAISLPASISAGDLLIVIFARPVAAASISNFNGFTQFHESNAVNAWINCAYKVAAGGDTCTYTTSTNTKSAHLTYRITGAEAPGTQAPEASTGSTATTLNPDPDTVTPTGGSKDYLWIATLVQAGEEADDDTWCTAAPSSFGNLVQKATDTAGTASTNASTAAADFASTASSMNPGTFTVVQSLASRALTIAVHPASAADANATPSTVAASASLPAPSAQANANTTPTTVASIAALTTPSAHADANATPTTVARIAAVPTPTIFLPDATATPATVAAAAAVPAPTVQANANATPSTVAAQAAVPAPSAHGSANPTPSNVAALAAIPAPSAHGNANATPSTAASVAAVSTPTVTTGSGAANATPATIAASTSVPTPIITSTANVTPATVSAHAAVPTPTIVVSTSAIATPATITALAIIPAPSAHGAANPTPNVIAGLAALNLPTITLSATATPARVNAIAAVPTPLVIVGEVGEPVDDPQAVWVQENGRAEFVGTTGKAHWI